MIVPGRPGRLNAITAAAGPFCYTTIPMDLSIVIPAFNEQDKIACDVAAAAAFIAEEGMTGEVIVVDDGSTDATAEAARAVDVPDRIPLRVIRYQPNRGKGYAVRTGMAATTARYVMFADSGLCVAFDGALAGLELLRSGRCEIAHGSRHLPASHILRPKGPYRRIVSWLFRKWMPLLTRTPRRLTDTQCGFKLYRGDLARRLYSRCVCEGFAFDVEVILRAARCKARILEFPIAWRSDPDSRLHPLHTIWRLMGELLAIRAALQ